MGKENAADLIARYLSPDVLWQTVNTRHDDK
jgi:hypothetical protein